MQDLRSTTGQRVTVSYDPRSNSLLFHESDWFADPIRSTAVPVKSDVVRPLSMRRVPPARGRNRRRPR